MSAPSVVLSDSDLAAISNLVATAHAAQLDPGTLLPLHALETVIVNIAGRRVLGRDALADAMAAALASPLKDVLTEVTIDDVRAASRDCAIVSCTKVVRDGRASADAKNALPTVGMLTYVLTRTDTGWKIALAQTTPIVAAAHDGQLEATVERVLAGEDSYDALTEREQAIVRAAWDQRCATDAAELHPEEAVRPAVIPAGRPGDPNRL